MSKAEKDQVKKMVIGYKHFNAAIERFLESYGLVIVRTRKHVLVARTDQRGGTVTLAKTPSDWRAGHNTASKLIHLLEI